MANTLGKRIVTHRKRVGLTQDQLAERLGVTAQAVSKWENDQSCPDISILPRLADIFGVSVDELLGRQSPVHEAEIVSERESDGLHLQSDDPNFDFRFNSGKKGAFGLAIWVLLAGGLLLTVQLLKLPVTLWDILWPTAILVFGVFGLFPKFSFWRVGCALLGGYFLLNNLHVLPQSLGRDILLPVFLLLFGLSLLADAFRKNREPKFSITVGEDGKWNAFDNDYQESGDAFYYKASFSDQDQYVSLPSLSSGEIHVSFGDNDLDLTGVEAVSDRCVLDAHCAFGDLTLKVPRKFLVKVNANTSFAATDFKGKPSDPPEGIILLSAHVSFGEITVEYV